VKDISRRALRDSLVGVLVEGATGAPYRLERCMAQGGQGWIFRARGAIDVDVIVKVLRPDAADAHALRRFQREAALLRALSQEPRPSQCIVRFYDHGVARVRDPSSRALVALPFTVLEHVSGITLAQALEASHERGLPLERVMRIVRHVADALRIVHARRVIHRDLKPSNILLATSDGTEIAKVTDFGFARFVDIGPLTTSVSAGVTLGYAPPEQYEKGNPRVSVRTDVFSLAAIIWEMLAGRPAFPSGENDSVVHLVARMTNGARPSLERDVVAPTAELAAHPDLLRAVDAELTRALASEPNDRHASIDELVASIEPYVGRLISDS
jgi:serine/threonine-protein kinase